MSAAPDDMTSMISSGMSDQDIQAMINQLGGVSATPEKNQALQQQIKMAQMLRSGPNMPQGQMAGKVYVGPSALQSLAGAVNQVQGVKSGQQAVQGMQQNASDQQGARTSYMKMLAQALRQNQGATNPSQAQNVAQGSDFSNIAGNDA